ncbi:MAG: GyrI-like domain-containing protein [Planctomycetota bacterium]
MLPANLRRNPEVLRAADSAAAIGVLSEVVGRASHSSRDAGWLSDARRFHTGVCAAYALTPQQFREARDVAPFLSAREVPNQGLDLDHLEADRLIVRVQHRPAWRVAAMRHIGPVESTASIWPAMIEWASNQGLLSKDSILLGIHNDYWDPLAEGKYRYEAAIVVPDDFSEDDFREDDQVNMITLPAGDLAMTEFSGSLRQADDVWPRFADQWLPISGYQIRTVFAYDRYPVDLLTGGVIQNIIKTLMGIRATFCMPVKKYR